MIRAISTMKIMKEDNKPVLIIDNLFMWLSLYMANRYPTPVLIKRYNAQQIADSVLFYLANKEKDLRLEISIDLYPP